MLRLLLILSISGLLLSTHVNAQQYTYSFSGSVKDSTELVTKIKNVEGILKCRLYLKPEKPGGAILFRLRPYEVTYDEKGNQINPNTLLNIKQELLQEGLKPEELIRLKN